MLEGFIDATGLLLQAGGPGKLTRTNSLDRKIIYVFPNAIRNLSEPTMVLGSSSRGPFHHAEHPL